MTSQTAATNISHFVRSDLFIYYDRMSNQLQLTYIIVYHIISYHIYIEHTVRDCFIIHKIRNTELFISPSGNSEIDCATTKTDTAERSISIGRESLQVFLY